MEKITTDVLDQCAILCRDLLFDWTDKIDVGFQKNNGNLKINVSIELYIDGDTLEVEEKLNFVSERIKASATRIISDPQMDLPIKKKG